MAREWTTKAGSAAVERQLELTLGLPGGDRRSWAPAPIARDVEIDDGGPSGLSLGLFTKCPKSSGASTAGGQRELADTVVEEADPCGMHVDMKACAAPSPAASVVPSADRNVANNRSQASTPAAAPVVGWPPIRSFRKNMATSSRLAHASKASATAADRGVDQPPLEARSNSSKGVFVKINMDGIPIGRKVDLKSCQGYDTLSTAVDKLFRGLLMASAQKAPTAAANRDDGEKPMITGLLDGTGEYTLVYEDDEGDRILVGDVPWEMFVTTAKRLRVLRTSELSKLSLGATSRKRAAPETA